MEIVNGYSNNQNVQMLIALMQAHGIRRVIISPGGTHNEIVAGLQYNGNFELYSTVDERGAAYMAVGMAAECGEPVAIICTESVASRNYYPAMTEAYYRQLPVLAITGVHGYHKIGHLYQQVIDRSESPADTFCFKARLPEIKDDDDIWASNILINKALLELRRHGGGPVHIDLPRNNEKEQVSYTAGELCDTRVIRRYMRGDALPEIRAGKTAVFIGTHDPFTKEQTRVLDEFCASHDAVVFCGHTSGYRGEYRTLTHLLASQPGNYDVFKDIDLLIHLGGPLADQATASKLTKGVKEVWRVNPDGEIRDYFKKLTNVFEMDEQFFFEHYSEPESAPRREYLDRCLSLTGGLTVPVQKLPFSNTYAAAMVSGRLPKNSLLFIGGSITLNAWCKADFDPSITSFSNMGTRGIDGVLSSFLGASFVDRNRICFCVLGDLTFFYDMNAIGNRDVGSNVRILLSNNGGGGLFKLTVNEQHKTIGDRDTDPYIAASGHFGSKSPTLVKGYAESLGFEYLTASSKGEFDEAYERFVTPERTDRPMLFEIFTNDRDESRAIEIMNNLDVSLQSATKQMAKQILGTKGTQFVKKIIK